METEEKVRENKLRRMVYRRGYRFCKSRLRDPKALGYGLIRVETPDGREAEGFDSPHGLGLTLNDLEKRLGKGGWAVYRLHDEDWKLLYVGSSNDPPNRFSTLSNNYWWTQVKHRKLTWYPTEYEARAAEARAVVSESPAHNVSLRSSDLTETVAIRITVQEKTDLDAARGQISRSEYLRRILLGAEPRLSGKYSLATLPPLAAAGCQAGPETEPEPGQITDPGSHVLSIKVPEEMLAQIDARADALGMTRSEWARAALHEEAQRKLARRKPAPHGIKIISDERMPPGAVALVSRGRDEVSVSAFSLGADKPEPERPRKDEACPHRLPPGAWCKTCKRTKAGKK